jgi:hypothetical protein
MKRVVYLIVVAVAFLLGALHSILAFVLQKWPSVDALWFFGTGLAQLFYSGLNLILARQGILARQAAGTDVRLIVRVSNVLMLVFIGFSAQILGLKGNPQVLVLAATGILMLGLSLVS